MPDPCLSAVRDPERERMLSLESLPPPTTRRWVARRKAQVVAAVAAGLMTEGEACRTYRMTAEELAGWQRSLALAGVRGLLATKRIQPRWIGQSGVEARNLPFFRRERSL